MNLFPQGYKEKSSGSPLGKGFDARFLNSAIVIDSFVYELYALFYILKGFENYKRFKLFYKNECCNLVRNGLNTINRS